MVTGDGTVAGLTVSRKVTVPNTGSQDFARTVDTFTNPTDAPITTTVTVVGNLGSDAATTVFATSDGTGVVSPNDQWIGTDDARTGGTPAMIHYIHGPAGLQPTRWPSSATTSSGPTTSPCPPGRRSVGLFHHRGSEPAIVEAAAVRPGDAHRFRRSGGGLPKASQGAEFFANFIFSSFRQRRSRRRFPMLPLPTCFPAMQIKTAQRAWPI